MGDCGDLADVREHLERALGVMNEFHRDFDRAQVLGAVGDINSAVISQLARSNYSMAAELYEEDSDSLLRPRSSAVPIGAVDGSDSSVAR